MHLQTFPRAAILMLAACCITSASAAQAPKGADTLSPGAIADSLKVLATLDARVRANREDAQAWYRRGMIAWALTERANKPNPPRNLDPTRLGHLADTSLRIAAQLAPTNAYYRMLVGRFLLWSGVSVTRYASGGFFEAALDVARKGTDPNMHAETAIELGRVAWRRYDALANRRIEITPGSAVRSLSTALNPSSPGVEPVPQPLKVVREIIESGTMPLPADLTGGDYLIEAAKLFREAYDAAPTNARTFRHVAMTIAERNQWTDLEAFSRQHLAAVPWDSWGWMALGLALQRQGNSVKGAAAFDSAMTLIDPHERARLDRLDHVMPSNDSDRVNRWSAAERTAYGRLYWLLADPLWGQSGNESRVEYFARVTFAELRWTVDELNVRGAETDRGDIYIRYGPPDLVAAFGPVVAAGSVDANGVSTTWVYETGLAFVFTGQPTFATARTAPADIAIVKAMTQALPVRWDNVAAPHIDSMQTLVTRFRGGRDSVDLVVAANPPLDSIRASQPKNGAPIRGDAWFLRAENASLAYHDSTTLTDVRVRTWAHRVAPGNYLMRLEASAEGAHTGARATGLVNATGNDTASFALRGFGLSDMLLATRAEPRNATARRWSDIDVDASTGIIPRGSPVALVWEAYELGERNGNAEYEVSVTVMRTQSTMARIGASVVGRMQSIARIDHGDDRVSISFDRTLPHATAIADYITVTLSDTPAGKYSISVQITDRVTGKVVSKTRAFVVAE